ncbi:MAG: hypothetical protein GX066_05375 [Clostridiaceae bacterium]|nr:hypothetical protein [Clostridiaceae bacterium]
MKKLLTLMMVFILSLSLVACGGEEITLQSQTVNGLTFDVPSDFGEFEDFQSQFKVAKNADSTASIAVSGRIDAEGITADSWDEELYSAIVLGSFAESQLLEFSNTDTVAGAPAIFAHYTGKNAKDIEVEGYNYYVYYDDGTYQSIAFTFFKDGNSSLEQNITAILNSIK